MTLLSTQNCHYTCIRIRAREHFCSTRIESGKACVMSLEKETRYTLKQIQSECTVE